MPDRWKSAPGKRGATGCVWAEREPSDLVSDRVGRKEGGGRLEAVGPWGGQRTGSGWELGASDPNPRPGLRTPQLPCLPDLISLLSQSTGPAPPACPCSVLCPSLHLSNYHSSLHLSVSVSPLSGPCPGLPVNGHPGIPPWLRKQESVGQREGWGRGWKGKTWVEGVGDSSNLILLVASPRCWTRRPKEDRLFPSKRALFASSVSAQSRKLISFAVNQNPKKSAKMWRVSWTLLKFFSTRSFTSSWTFLKFCESFKKKTTTTTTKTCSWELQSSVFRVTWNWLPQDSFPISDQTIKWNHMDCFSLRKKKLKLVLGFMMTLQGNSERFIHKISCDYDKWFSRKNQTLPPFDAFDLMWIQGPPPSGIFWPGMQAESV